MRGADRDLVTAAAVGLFAAAYLYLGRGLEPGVVQGVPGPGAVPRVVAVGILLCAAWLGLRGLLALGRQPAAAREGGPPGRGRALALYGLFVLYALVIPWLGFPLATLGFTLGAMAGALRLGLIRSAVYAVAITLLAEGLFHLGLDVPLPRGWLFQ